MISLVLSIDDLPIPPKAIAILKAEDISTLYPPQEDAIKKGLFNRKNLVLSVPTASGKTLVAELAIIKNLFEARGKCLYLVPLRALASEKYNEFKKYESLGYRVGITTGDYDTTDEWLANYDIIVSTNEKANSLLRHHAKWLKDLGLIVADEIHLINDTDRGSTLEIVITQLRELNPDVQILALSATIQNADEIANWLDAELVQSTWRPVELREYVCYQNTVWASYDEKEKLPRLNTNPVINIILNTIKKNGQILIFTNTRQNSVSMAKRASKFVVKYLSEDNLIELKEIAKSILSAGEITKISRLLSSLVLDGVAFHHAGLSHAHRTIIEDAFRKNKLKVIAATPTLAAGVNLPARVVIISSYHRYDLSRGYSQIPVLEYKQMVGRAGRPKYDKIGYSYIIAKTQSQIYDLLEKYVFGEPEEITSKLSSEQVLISHILGVITSGYCNTIDTLLNFFSKTFYGYQKGTMRGIKRVTRNAIDFLSEHDFITFSSNRYLPTSFGKRTSELYISPFTALIFRDALDLYKKPTTAFGYLHLVSHTPDMPKMYFRKRDYEIYESILDERFDEFLVSIPSFDDPYEYEKFLSEIKIAEILKDWIDERSEDYIIEKFDIGSGDLYRLVENSKWLLYSLSEIAKILRYSKHIQPINKLISRVKYGVREELLELVQIENIGRIRARILYNAGYTNIQALRKATVADIAKLPNFGTALAKKIIAATS